MSRVNRWISFVLESDVEEQDQTLDAWFGQMCYRLPYSVLVAKSVTVLTLLGCRLESTCGAINLEKTLLIVCLCRCSNHSKFTCWVSCHRIYEI